MELMTNLVNEKVLFEDRVKLPMSFDVAKMLDEIRALNLEDFIEYSVMPLRSPAHLVDPSVAPPPLADDYADGSWTEWLDTSVLRNSPYLSSVVDTFRSHSRVTLVRLLRLASGGIVVEHNDPTLGLEIEKSVIRLTIPIQTNEGVEFFLNNELVPMEPGECWYLRLTDPHRIVNAGDMERINMTIDMEPNEWVRSFILNQKMP